MVPFTGAVVTVNVELPDAGSDVITFAVFASTAEISLMTIHDPPIVPEPVMFAGRVITGLEVNVPVEVTTSCCADHQLTDETAAVELFKVTVEPTPMEIGKEDPAK